MRTPLRSEIVIPVAGVELCGTIDVPPRARGLVLFAHGSGSSRFSPRNRRVAGILHGLGFATLLFDLLTEPEERVDAVDATLRFDVDLLAERLVAVTDWIRTQPAVRDLPLAYFGASTGAAAALVAAARRPDVVHAVVCRGGRPDLAEDALARVRAPTLLIVGGADLHVLELNRTAAKCIVAPNRVVIVPGATHLFEEPGALEDVAQLAGDWLATYLGPSRLDPSPVVAREDVP